MTDYDMNKEKDEASYVKLLDRPGQKSPKRIDRQLQLSAYAHRHKLDDLTSLLSDVDIIFDIDDQGVLLGV